MRTNYRSQRVFKNLLCGLGLFITASSIGCDSHIGGQILPSPWNVPDDIQYCPPGPEFKLSKEAAAQAATKAE